MAGVREITCSFKLRNYSISCLNCGSVFSSLFMIEMTPVALLSCVLYSVR